MKAWKIALISIVAIAVIVSLYIHSAYNVKIQDVQVNDLQDISLKGFVIGGDVIVRNEGLLPVNTNKMEYKVFLEGLGEELANGVINGTFMMPQKNASIPFSNSIKWVPTAEIAWNLITGGNTYVKITGWVTVIDFSFMEVKLPFEKRVDLKPYITQFAKQKAQQIAENLSETAGEAAKQAVGRIKTL